MSQDVAARFLTTSRELGEAVNPTHYPTVAMIERETHFNAMNPFWQAPFAYGAGVVLLVLSLAFATVTGKPAPQTIAGSTLYGLGLAALADRHRAGDLRVLSAREDHGLGPGDQHV